MASIPFVWEEEPGKPNFPNNSSSSNNNNNFIVHDHGHGHGQDDCHGSSAKVLQKLPLPPVYTTLLMEAQSVTNTSALSRPHSFFSTFKLQSIAHYVKKTFLSSATSTQESSKNNTQDNSIWLDFNNETKKKKEKNYSAPLPKLDEPTTTTTNNNKCNSSAACSLRRCSSDREREREKSRRQLMAMFDPTCSALDQLFPLKTSLTTTTTTTTSTSTFSRHLESLPPQLHSDAEEQVNYKLVYDHHDKLVSQLQQLPSSLHLAADQYRSKRHSSSRLDFASEALCVDESSNGSSGCSNLLQSSSMNPTQEKWNHGSTTLDSSQRMIRVQQHGHQEEREEEDEERKVNSVPCPKISRVLLSLVETEEKRLLLSRRHKRGKQQLQCFHPVFSSIARAVLCRSKNSNGQHFLSSSYYH